MIDFTPLGGDEGACVVVTTHDLQAAAVADVEIHLDDGRMEWIRGMPI
ncbi:hypothetical protein GCM10027599_19140 [Yimella radicis]